MPNSMGAVLSVGGAHPGNFWKKSVLCKTSKQNSSTIFYVTVTMCGMCTPSLPLGLQCIYSIHSATCMDSVHSSRQHGANNPFSVTLSCLESKKARIVSVQFVEGEEAVCVFLVLTQTKKKRKKKIKKAFYSHCLARHPRETGTHKELMNVPYCKCDFSP